MWKFLIISLSICPVITVIALGLWSLMPDCIGGDVGYPSGCYLLGVNLNWFIQIGILASLGMMLTFVILPYLIAAIIVATLIYWIIVRLFKYLIKEDNTARAGDIKFKIPASTTRRVLHKLRN